MDEPPPDFWDAHWQPVRSKRSKQPQSPSLDPELMIEPVRISLRFPKQNDTFSIGALATDLFAASPETIYLLDDKGKPHDILQSNEQLSISTWMDYYQTMDRATNQSVLHLAFSIATRSGIEQIKKDNQFRNFLHAKSMYIERNHFQSARIVNIGFLIGVHPGVHHHEDIAHDIREAIGDIHDETMTENPIPVFQLRPRSIRFKTQNQDNQPILLQTTSLEILCTTTEENTLLSLLLKIFETGQLNLAAYSHNMQFIPYSTKKTRPERYAQSIQLQNETLETIRATPIINIPHALMRPPSPTDKNSLQHAILQHETDTGAQLVSFVTKTNWTGSTGRWLLVHKSEHTAEVKLFIQHTLPAIYQRLTDSKETAPAFSHRPNTDQLERYVDALHEDRPTLPREKFLRAKPKTKPRFSFIISPASVNHTAFSDNLLADGTTQHSSRSGSGRHASPPKSWAAVVQIAPVEAQTQMSTPRRSSNLTPDETDESTTSQTTRSSASSNRLTEQRTRQELTRLHDRCIDLNQKILDMEEQMATLKKLLEESIQSQALMAARIIALETTPCPTSEFTSTAAAQIDTSPPDCDMAENSKVGETPDIQTPPRPSRLRTENTCPTMINSTHLVLLPRTGAAKRRLAPKEHAA